MINSLESVLYSALFLLPGGIINAIVKSITPTKKFSSSQELLRWIAYSILNWAIWSWLFLIILKHLDSSKVCYWIILLVTLSITSIVTGYLIGLIQSKSIIRRIAKRLGLNIEHSVPTGWDFVFSKRDSPCFIIVSMDDGTKYYGYFGENSLASSDNDNRDIYIEYIYDLDEDGSWKPASNCRGALINSSHISSVEFLEQEEEKYE